MIDDLTHGRFMKISDHTDSCGRLPDKRGFTLLELLLSMGILSIIVLIVAQIFNQTTLCWETGSKKAEQNMVGRAVTDFIAKELSHAVFDGTNINEFALTANAVTFITLDNDPTTSRRILRKIEYKFVGPPPGIIQRRSFYRDAAVPYDTGAFTIESPWIDLCPNEIVELRFYADAYVLPNLPPYVDVCLQVERKDDYSRYNGTADEALYIRRYETRAYLMSRKRYAYD